MAPYKKIGYTWKNFFLVFQIMTAFTELWRAEHNSFVALLQFSQFSV